MDILLDSFLSFYSASYSRTLPLAAESQLVRTAWGSAAYMLCYTCLAGEQQLEDMLGRSLADLHWQCCQFLKWTLGCRNKDLVRTHFLEKTDPIRTPNPKTCIKKWLLSTYAQNPRNYAWIKKFTQVVFWGNKRKLCGQLHFLIK